MDLSSRPRHTHRSLARSRADAGPADGLSRSESLDLKRLVLRAQAQCEDERIAPTVAQIDVGDPAPLSFIAETIEEQASQGQEITARMKAVLNQCLLMAIADSEQAFSPPLIDGGSQTPEELLRALARVVAASGGARAGLRSAASRSAYELEESIDSAFDQGGEPSLFEQYERLKPVDVRSNAVAALVKRHRQKFAPVVTVTPDGLRLETFEDGAEMIKDSLGRVFEVRSAVGEGLSLHYDRAGNLERFLRSDSQGRAHSVGVRDKHGVAVRDPDGRLRAFGELMTVDPRGCLTVHNQDGQMVSLDLVRELHIERRRVGGSPAGTITAVFAHDGFRLATHFHEVPAAGGGGPKLFGQDVASPLRFYGRDGSLVEFACDEELLAVRPSRVLPPGSLFVDLPWRSKRRACTAWESVQEYLELLL